MGILGLHKALSCITEERHLEDYRGQTVAVDASSWLHKGAYGCAYQLCNNKPTTKYVDYILDKIACLRFHGVEPHLVFDGCAIPLKRDTNAARGSSRSENLARGHSFRDRARTESDAAQKQQLWDQAHAAYQKAVRVTWEMARAVIDALLAPAPGRPARVGYVVAPFEADAQIALLCATGKAAAAVSEDSDLLVYSVACRHYFPVLYKLDFEEATFQEVVLAPMAAKTGGTDGA